MFLPIIVVTVLLGMRNPQTAGPPNNNASGASAQIDADKVVKQLLRDIDRLQSDAAPRR